MRLVIALLGLLPASAVLVGGGAPVGQKGLLG